MQYFDVWFDGSALFPKPSWNTQNRAGKEAGLSRLRLKERRGGPIFDVGPHSSDTDLRCAHF
jgi:hypothetical protein